MTANNHDEVPVHQLIPGLYRLPVLSYPLPPIETTNCFVIGDPGGETIIVDPSPRDPNTSSGIDEYDRLVNTLNRLKATNDFIYSGIFITHHHFDHHLNAPRLAKEFNVPILISKDSHHRIKGKQGDDYFAGLEVRCVKEGDVLINWQDKGVRVFEVPGHDDGQLALAPKNMHWFLVGDLIQGMGTVVIGLDEGDMNKYFHSLERVIQLNPKVILPSHGKCQRSTGLLKKTLKHRLKREKQVLKLHNRGYTAEQMVALIYKNVDRRLWSLALQNIKSHLKRIESIHIGHKDTKTQRKDKTFFLFMTLYALVPLWPFFSHINILLKG
jgi:endoribonuclease LACTB2